MKKPPRSAEEVGSAAVPSNRPSSEGWRSSAWSRRPGSSPEGASQLRDSAGLAPDFAVSSPAGDMCPADGDYYAASTPDGASEATSLASAQWPSPRPRPTSPT